MLKILEKLISAKSISPNQDGALDYVKEILEKYGFKCYLKEFGTGIEKTTNLYAEFGSNGKNLCFAGHVDVVPTGDETLWNFPPFKMTIEENTIYGRGVVDMKGAVACMVKVLIEHAKSHNNNKVSLLLTSDEEASGTYGTKVMLEWMKKHNIKIDFSIIGEPTSSKVVGDTIKIGRRGSINFELKINGKQGHVAYPDFAINPNNIIIRILNNITHYKLDNGNKIFQPSNIEITSIDVGNNTTNLIPQTATAKFNIRFNNIKTSDQIISDMNFLVKKYTSDYTLTTKVNSQAFVTEITDFMNEFSDIVKDIYSISPEFSTSGGTSDARFIKDNCPVLEFGLLNQTAHQINERAEFKDLQKLYTVYYRAIKSYHNEGYS